MIDAAGGILGQEALDHLLQVSDARERTSVLEGTQRPGKTFSHNTIQQDQITTELYPRHRRKRKKPPRSHTSPTPRPARRSRDKPGTKNCSSPCATVSTRLGSPATPAPCGRHHYKDSKISVPSTRPGHISLKITSINESGQANRPAPNIPARERFCLRQMRTSPRGRSYHHGEGPCYRHTRNPSCSILSSESVIKEKQSHKAKSKTIEPQE